MEKLTEQEANFVADSEGLIYSFCHKYHYNVEEHYGDCAIGLCRAIKTWNPDKGKWSTWAYLYMRSECYSQTEKKKNTSVHKLNFQGKHIISNEKVIGLAQETEDISNKLLVQDITSIALMPNKMLEELEINELCAIIKQHLTPQEYDIIINYSLHDITMVELARKYKVSKQRIHHIKQKACVKLQKILYDIYY